jgi:alcohol dehydrogenase YqhD (iron-dependent ADH family)
MIVWMDQVLNEHTLPRFVKFARHVMAVPCGHNDWETAKRGIRALYDFFVSLGLPMHLKEVGIDESRLAEMAHHVAVKEGLDRAYVPLEEKDILAIFRASL